MKILVIRIPQKAIPKLFRLKAKKNGAHPRRAPDQPTSDPTPVSTSVPMSDTTTSNLAPPDSTPGPSRRRLPKRLPDPLRNRLIDIFPLGLESKSPNIRAPYTFAAHYLHDVFLHNRGNQHAERTVVKSAWYGKQIKAAQHEFIVVHVEDPAIPGLRNCIAIDRNQPNPDGNATTAFSSPPASDTFRVAYDGDLKRLLRESRLTPYLELEEISFQSDEPMHLKELVTLVHHVSEGHRTYNPVDTNCYWFTGLIWECMRQLRRTAEYKPYAPVGRKGRIGCVRIIPNPIQVQNVLRDLSHLKDPDPDLDDSKSQLEVELAATASQTSVATASVTELCT